MIYVLLEFEKNLYIEEEKSSMLSLDLDRSGRHTNSLDIPDSYVLRISETAYSVKSTQTNNLHYNVNVKQSHCSTTP